MFLRILNLSKKCRSKLAKTKNTLSFIFLILSFTSAAYTTDVVEKTVAVVNNEPILLTDVHQLESRLSKSGMIDDLLLFDSSPDLLKKDQKGQLQFLINEKVIDSEVKRHNMTITMDRVDLEIRDIAKRNNMTKEDLLKTIQAQGISVADYQAFMKQRIERQSVVEQEVTSKIRLSDDDVLAFYTNETKKTIARINEYALSHIFFDPEKGGHAEALRRAEETLKEIRDGKPFDSLLTKKTEETSPSPNGLLGVFKSGEFSGEMERAVRDLNIGGVSEIVKSRSGYHIIKLVNKKIIVDPEFEKSKEKYRGLLFEKVFKRQFRAWIELKREEATIKIN